MRLFFGALFRERMGKNGTQSFEMRTFLFFFIVSVIFQNIGVAFAIDPIVENVTLVQRLDDSGFVEVTYDVFDADGDTMAIALTISEDGGNTWNFPCPSVDGDVGQSVLSGTGKMIAWNLENDSPQNQGTNLMARVVASDEGVEHTTHSPGNYSVIEFGELNWEDKGLIERISKADVFVYSGMYLWGHSGSENLRVVERLKELNPDLVILGYVLAKTVYLNWINAPINSLNRTLYDRTRPYWSYTTEGDTLFDWPGQVVVNILNPDCREAIAGTFAEFAQASNNQVDGFFWDYFNKKIWIAFSVEDQVDGFPDMDGNGIPMAEDLAEIEAYKAACDSLVMRTQELMGEDFVQVFNGQRAMSDSSFAALGDGMYYEIFPTELFPDPNMANALNPDYEFNLFRTISWPRTENGGPYNLLGNMWQNIYFDQNGDATLINLGNLYRVVGLLTGNYSSWLPGGGHHYDWTNVEINLGDPLSPTVITGNHYFRQYQYGTVDLHMESGTYPNPFRYEIKINGRVVDAFDMPYHFP